MSFEGMGFEQVESGCALMSTKGFSFGRCILLDSDLVNFLDENLGVQELEQWKEFPENFLIELTQGQHKDMTRNQRIQVLLDSMFVSVDGNALFTHIANLWHQGFVLSCATKPLDLPLFVQAVQLYQNKVEDLNLTTHWCE